MSALDVRETARRHNRMVSVYVVMQCWARRLDVIYLDGDQLRGIAHDAGPGSLRSDWLLEDLGECFPVQRRLEWTSNQRLAGVFISAIDFSGFFPQGVMETDRRIKTLREAGYRVGRLEMQWDSANPAELHRLLADCVFGFTSLSSFRSDEDETDQEMDDDDGEQG